MTRFIGGGAVVGLLLVLVSASHAAKTREELNRESEARMKKDVVFLASDECEGRGPTTQGINKAADYIAAQFKQMGLRPGYKNSYFQPFTITGAVGSLVVTGPLGQTIEFKQGVHFQPLGYDQDGSATAPLVFAGYGISSKNPAYDDYADLDVKGKIVVILRDTPRATGSRTKDMADGAPFAVKLTQARIKGAAGVLLVNDAETAADGDAPLDFSFTSLTRTGGKHVLSQAARRCVLEAMLPAGLTLSAIEKGIDRDLKPNSFELSGWTARMEVKAKNDAIPLKNVVGVLEGSGPLAQQTVVVGAHYDHLGYGGPSSNAPSKKRQIHHGADDNGSGSSGLLELARRFAAMPNREGRRIVFIAFSGEELGLFGSVHYCKEPSYPLAETAAMFNLDMIGRLKKDKSGLFRLQTEGHGTAKPFKEMIDNAAKKHGFALVSQASGSGPSDHDSFNMKKVPVLFLWTGVHADYHKPSDTADKINVEGMRRIVDMSEELVTALTKQEKPAYVTVKGTPTGRPSSSGPRLGIRPGYNEGEEGVLVEGVSSGGPAEKAGLKDGDRIVKIAGKEIKNLNVYMQTMAQQKKGTVLEVEVLREMKRMTIKVNLE